MSLADNIVAILETRQAVDGFKVISLGCGMALAESNPKWGHLTGVDIYNYHNACVNGFIQHDVRKVREVVTDNSYDLVLCLDIIEHLEREEGFKLIEDAEAIAKKAVVFYTPLKWDENVITDTTCWAWGNPYNIHKSLWGREDFEGYETYKVLPQDSEPVGFLAVKWL